MSVGGKAGLRERTRDFAAEVIRLYTALPRTVVAQVIGRQLQRAGTSVGAHFRERTRSRSDAECISKFEGEQQELEEVFYWLDLAAATRLAPAGRLAALSREAGELMAMLAASVKTVKRRSRR